MYQIEVRTYSMTLRTCTMYFDWHGAQIITNLAVQHDKFHLGNIIIFNQV